MRGIVLKLFRMTSSVIREGQGGIPTWFYNTKPRRASTPHWETLSLDGIKEVALREKNSIEFFTESG
jgi:hypothetical protein